MSFRNSQSTYGSVAKFFHWTVFLMVFALIIVGFLMDSLQDAAKPMIYNLHKLAGLSILLLMLCRTFWRLINPRPQWPQTMSSFQQHFAVFMHWVMYLVLLAMPLAGWIMATAAGRSPHFQGYILAMPGIPESEALAKAASSTHEVLAWVIIGLVVGHVLAAFYHLLVDRDVIMGRIMPGRDS